MNKIQAEKLLHTPIERIFSYFQKPESHLRLSPAEFQLRIKSHSDTYIGKFFGISYQVKSILHPLENGTFSIEQIFQSPFLKGKRIYQFSMLGPSSTSLKDEISYSVPFFEKKANRALTHSLSYSHRVLMEDLKRLALTKNPCTVLMTGGTGLIGKQLTSFLRLMGYKVFLFSRKHSQDPWVISWDPKQNLIPLESIPKADVVIHLAGESIMGLWTQAKKRRIIQSRLQSTQFLIELIQAQRLKPKVFITAAADGIYPLESSEVLTESSPYGDHFLAKVCKEWETASWKIPAERIIQARFSPVFSLFGGFFKRAYRLFRIGLGATFGKGSEKFSWVYLDDVLYQIHHMILTSSLSGPINVVSPDCSTGQKWTSLLAHHLQKPLWLKIPRFLLFVTGKDFATNVLLTDRQIFPKKIIDSGGIFSYPAMEDCLCHMIGGDQKTTSTQEE